MTEKIKISNIFEMKNQRILFINPPIEDFAFFDLWSKPVGLLYLAERVRRNGNDVSFIDCIHEGAVKTKTYGREKIRKTLIDKPEVFSFVNRKYYRFGLTEDEIIKRLSDLSDVDYIFLTSVMTYWYGGVRFLIDIIKRVKPNTPIVLGGVYARLCPEHAMMLGADFLVTDNWIPDVPYPAMDLYEKLPYGVTMTSFGCPFACEYCASKLLWPCYMRRSLDEVMAEIDYQYNLGARDIAFYDDALLVNKENYFYPMCKKVRECYGDNIRLHTPNGLHVRLIDEKCADLMMTTGFKTIRLSLESVDPELLNLSDNKVKREDYARAVKNLKNVGYTTKDLETYILLGLPGQSVASVVNTIDFVHEHGGNPKLAEFSPIPGTVSFNEEVVLCPEIRDEPLLQNNTVYSTYVSHHMSGETLQQLKCYARGWTPKKKSEGGEFK